MRKLFVVTSNPTTIEQDEVFQEWIEANFNWWHWLNQTWLLVDEDGTHTAVGIRDEVKELFPGVHFLVLETRADGGTRWAGFGPNSATESERNMFTWLKENWHL